MVGAANATETVAALRSRAGAARVEVSETQRDWRGLQERRAIFGCDARLELVRLSL